MFLTLFLVVYHVLVWLRELADLAALRSAFEEVLTLGASPVLLLLDAAPEPEPVLVPHAAAAIYSNLWIIAGMSFYFFSPVPSLLHRR